MKHRRQAGEELPAIRGPGGHLVDPRDPEDAITELSSQERQRYFTELRTAVTDVARALLDEENTYQPGKNRPREPDKSGYQAMASYFNLETWADDPKITWEENTPFLRAHREDREPPPGVAPVAEHCTASVTAHVVTPWGQRLSRTRICSTRGKHFWYSKGRDGTNPSFNLSKYRDGAEHICAGIAETRAINAVTDAALWLGYQQMSDDEVTAAARERDQKRKHSELMKAQSRWQDVLRRNDVSVEEEEAFYVLANKLPNEEQAFELEDYETALAMVNRHGPEVFGKCLRRYRKAQGCPDCGEPLDGATVCAECGWTEGPPPAGEKETDQEEDEESNDPGSADPDEADERAETEASEPDERAETEEDRETAQERRNRKTLKSSIYGTCKLLGEDDSYADSRAGDLFPEKADEDGWGDIETLTREELAGLDRALSEELQERGDV